MINRHAGRFALAAAALAGTTGLAYAGNQSELQELRARIDALEAAKVEPGKLPISPSTTLDVYGYVKADFFYDLDYDQGNIAVVTSIGEPSNATDGKFGATIRQSRLGFKTVTKTDIGDVKGQLEYDLYGGGSSSPQLRVRHANVRIGDHWLVGRTWTNFMPINEYPSSVEFNGPIGITFARTAQIRYSNSFADGFDYSLSIEENSQSSDDPVLTGAFQYSNDLFTARVAGLAGKITDGTTEVDQTGVTLSAALTPWAGGSILASYVTGEALGRLMIGFGDPIVGGEANDVDGYTVGFSQKLGQKWTVGLVYGKENYDLGTVLEDHTLSFTDLETIHLNAFYQVTDKLTLSAEYFMGERNDTISGNTFDGDRFQVAVQMNF